MTARENDAAAAADGIALLLPSRAPKKKKWKPVQWLCFGIALIPIISFIVFSGVPVVMSFVSMFTEMDNNDLTTMQWNNFQNFVEVFRDERFWGSWGTTFWLATAQVVTLVIALVISVLLNAIRKFSNVFQVIFFIPYICSSIAIAIMWKWIFSSDEAGVLNTILGKTVLWTSDPKTMTWTIVVAIIWQAPGYGIVMYKAALANIDKEQYEAAALDGAGPVRALTRILVPASRPAIVTMLVLVFMWTWNEFLIALVMTPGGSLRTAPLGLATFQGQYTSETALLAAGAVIIALPTVILFLFLQRHFIRGMLEGVAK